MPLPFPILMGSPPAVRSLNNRTDTITFTTDVQMEVTVAPGRYDLGL